MSTNKVIHITILHNRYDTRIFQKECMSLSKKYDVLLIVNDNSGNETINNIKIIDLGVKNNNRLTRLINCIRKINNILIKEKPDIIQVHDPELLLLYHVINRKYIFVFDLHDDLVLQILEKEYIPRIIRKPISLCSSVVLKFFIGKIDGIITAADYLTDIYKNYNKNILTIWNYPITNLIAKKSSNAISEKVNILFIGTAYTGRSIEDLCKLLAEPIFNEAFTFTIIGETSELLRDRIKEFSKQDNIRLVSHMNYRDLYQVIESYDIGFICDYGFERNNEIIPIKLLEYMAAGLPVITSSLPMVSKIVEDCNNGYIVDLGRRDGMKEVLQEIIENPDKLRELGENSLIGIKRYDWSIMEDRLLRYYDNLLTLGERDASK